MAGGLSTVRAGGSPRGDTALDTTTPQGRAMGRVGDRGSVHPGHQATQPRDTTRGHGYSPDQG